MLKKLIFVLSVLFKIAGLLLILSVERVIGLPFVFVLLGLIWLDRTSKQTYLFVTVMLVLSYLLAAVYHVSWLISFLIWLISSISITLGSRPVRQKKRRFLIVVILQCIFWLWWARMGASYLLLVQFVASYLLVIMWMRILKVERLVNKSKLGSER